MSGQQLKQNQNSTNILVQYIDGITIQVLAFEKIQKREQVWQ
jgi:hypothetical protein